MKKLLLLSFAFLWVSGGAFAALSGTYSINAGAAASATNYTTVSSAISDLMLGTRADGGPVNGPGVSGPVVLRIAAGSGPYTEQLDIGAIAGVSAVNSIRITGGPTRETITFGATTTGLRGIFKLNGCRHITLDSLRLVNTGVTWGYGVHITNSADSNTVKNCKILLDSTSTSTNFAGISISGSTVTTSSDAGDANLIQNNEVRGGYYGLTARGLSTTVFNQRNRFLNNSVYQCYFYGAYLYQQNLAVFSGNRLYPRTTGATGAYGAYLYYQDGLIADGNLVQGSGTYGFYIAYHNTILTTGRSKITNNMIGGGWRGTTPYGIYMTTNSFNVDVWHNSVNMDNGNGRSIYILSGSGNDVRNNIFSIIGSTTGYALYVSLTTYVSAVDYNLYYAPGSSNFIFVGAAYTTATFIGGGGYNLNSKNGDPMFVNPTNNLHINSGTLTYDAGLNLGITNDIDGDVRPLAPSTGYDIGADEHNLANNDAGITALNSPSPPFAAGVQPVSVTLKNYGLVTLTSADIKWSVNGVPQTPLAWTGSIAPAASLASISIGTYSFAAGATYSMKIWSDNPNGSSDANNINDTLKLNICVAMNGTYTIGGVGADFATINDAVDRLVCGGVSGPTILRLVAGTGPFNEQVEFPAIPGASATNYVRLTGGPGRETVSTGSSTTAFPAVIRLTGTDNIILDSLTIRNTGLATAWGVQITASADSNTVSNCLIYVDSSVTVSSVAGICMTGNASPTTAGDNGDYNKILNNEIYGGYYGISIRGTSTTIYNFYNRVEGNKVYSYYFYGIMSAYQDYEDVIGNTVRSRNSGSTSNYGIYFLNADRFTVLRNRITNVGVYGIYGSAANYQGGVGTDRALVANNMIGGDFRGATPYGLYFTGTSSYIDIFHNSVSMDFGNGRGCYILSGVGNDIRNNSFSITNSATGYAFYVTNATSVSSVDYNNFYAPGSSNFIYIGAAYTPATFIGGGGFNVNSRTGNPNYKDEVTNLHVVGVQLNDAGDNSAGITTDFDLQTRPLAPSVIVDIGADEFTPLQYDAYPISLYEPVLIGSCPDSFAVVSVILGNNGMDTMTNIEVTVDIYGASTATLTDTLFDPLLPGEKDTLIVGTFNSWPGGNDTFAIWVAHPLEEDLLNDTIVLPAFVSMTAPPPTGTGASACAPDSVMLSVASMGYINQWYDAPAGGTFLMEGDTFMTPLLTSTTSYYVESYLLTPAALHTTLAGGNGCMGNMFDVEAYMDIEIDSLYIHVGTTTLQTVTLYYRNGGYAGFETNAAAWIPWDTLTVTGAGAGNPTHIVPSSTLMIPSGARYGIYVTLTVTDIDYTNGATTYSNPDLAVFNGVGLCSLFGGTNVGREWNGSIWYRGMGCPSLRTEVIADIHSVSVDLGADTSSCGDITLDAGNPGFSYLWSTTDSTQTITTAGTGLYSVVVTDSIGCSGSDSVSVGIFGFPVVNIGADTSACSDLMLDAGNPGLSFLWNNGDTTQTSATAGTGVYNVDVTNASGCTTSDTINFTLLESPAFSFSADTTLCPLISFTSSMTSGTAPFTYFWDFGDGNTSTLDNPMNDYTTAGNGIYTVELIVSNTCGDDTIIVLVEIDCLIGSGTVLAQGLSVAPNPNEGIFTLSSSLSGEVAYSIFTMQGIQVRNGVLDGLGKIEFDLSQMAKGLYLLHVQQGSESVVYRVQIN